MKIVMKKIAAVTLATFVVSGSALADTASADLAVSTTVNNHCTISTTPLAFDEYDPIVANAETPLNGQGTIILTCTKGAGIALGLGAGDNAEGPTRRLANGLNYLDYEIYTDSTYATVWDATGPALLPAANSAPIPITVYGQIPAAQDVPKGAYNDTIQATVTY